jgi:glycine cleavage system T protein
MAEHLAVRQSVGLADASARLLLRAVGSDRLEFLHGLTTNHIKDMKPGEGTYNAHLNSKGKMVGDLIVYTLADHLILDISAACAKAVGEALDYYHFSEEVEFTDITAQHVVLGLHGPDAPKVLDKLSTMSVSDLPDYHFRRGNLAEVPILVARVNRTGEEGFELHAPIDGAEPIWKSLLAEGAVPVGCEALDSLRIEAGIPRFGADMDDTVVPWEAGIDHAIHLNKGCYVGQEVIARMEYLGRVSRKLVALVMEGDKVPAVGGEVGHDGENVGRVTSACFGPTVGKPLALAYVKYDHSDAGTTLVVEAGGEALPATVTQPPMAGETPPPKGSRG